MRLILAAALAVPLAANAAAAPEARLPACFACHGENGQSRTPDVPSLGGQPAGYLLIQLYVFREKIRPVEIMNEQAKGLSDDDLQHLSDTIARLPAPAPVADGSDPARMARGQALVRQHHCNSCHAPNLGGQDQVPRLASQREDYLVKSLRAYKSGERPGYDPAMASVVQPLTDDDFATLAHYLARMP